ncbi:MAG: hypothetical protein M1132_03600 [Chloroflexi bacterium]|nr:hypothetical protein [Chloroflexota bacterium]
MPKRKPSAGSSRSKNGKSSSRSKAVKTGTGNAGSLQREEKRTSTVTIRPPIGRGNYNEEYAEYLERYELYGEGRARLSPGDFDRLDEEMLDLLALEAEQGPLSDEQIVRLQELEYLLLDTEQ